MQKATKIMYALAQAGHATYIVGGAVRDIFLGNTSKDIDLVTLATPKLVAKVARENNWETVGVGAAFGITVVIVDGVPYEVATARTEWYGEDSHRPEGVSYTSDIEVDLSRRDFTINAMAMTMAGEVIDPFGGRQDLRAGIIRCVGNPADRFSEDALRAFRALRFAARYGFQIDKSTLAAIPGCLGRVSGLSVERVRDELEEILLAPHAAGAIKLLVKTNLADTNCRYRENGTEKRVSVLPELMHLVGLEQNPWHHRFDAWGHTLAVVDGVPRDLALRWAALLHDVAKGLPGIRALNKHGEISDHDHDIAGADMVPAILGRLKVHPAIIDRVAWLVRHHMTLPAANRKSVIKWLNRQARNFRSKEVLADAVHQLLALRRADLLAGKANPDLTDLTALVAVVNDVLASVPFYSSDLAITGGQVAQVLGAGPQVGKFLDNLLSRVQGGQLVNSADVLLSALQARASRLAGKH